MPKDLPDDPALLKQLLEQMLERETNRGGIVHLEEGNALLRQCWFGRKSEQTDPATPRLALFNEVERVVEAIDEDSEGEGRSPHQAPWQAQATACRSARIEVIHERPEYELTCVCDCRKHAIGEEISEQLEQDLSVMRIQKRPDSAGRFFIGRFTRQSTA